MAALAARTTAPEGFCCRYTAAGTGAEVPAMRLPDEMKEMVERLGLCYVATVTPDGKPNLSPKGSLKVWDDEIC